MSRPTWWTAGDAQADRAARFGGQATTPAPIGGWLARYSGPCWGGCDTDIVANETRVWPTERGWVCVACAGVSDE